MGHKCCRRCSRLKEKPWELMLCKSSASAQFQDRTRLSDTCVSQEKCQLHVFESNVFQDNGHGQTPGCQESILVQ